MSLCHQVTGDCFSWTSDLPGTWQVAPSLQVRRAFGLLTSIGGEVHMLGGLDGTLSPLSFRQVENKLIAYCALALIPQQALEEEMLGAKGWSRSRCKIYKDAFFLCCYPDPFQLRLKPWITPH